jgi:undecaprenyl diphosphate synthase
MDFYRENNIRIRHAGNREGLPADVLQDLDEACAGTGSFGGLQVILALNYGGRDEIVRAVKKLINSGDSATAKKLSQYMDNPDIPDPDLIIRTAGEFRTSNFLLWEGAYAEYYISDKLWPDWTGDDLEKAILAYKNRNRRFGDAK